MADKRSLVTEYTSRRERSNYKVPIGVVECICYTMGSYRGLLASATYSMNRILIKASNHFS